MNFDRTSLVGDRRRYMVPAALFIGIAVVLFLIYHDFVLSSFLRQDDNIYLPKALLGEPDFRANSPGKFIFIRAIATVSGSVAVIKFFNLLFMPAIAVCVYAILMRLNASRATAALLACLIVSYPVAIDQPVFVSGAHPTMGAFWTLLAAYFFLRADAEINDKARFLRSASAVFVLTLIAAMFSPIFFLMPLAPSLWLLASAALNGSHRTRRVLAGLALLPVAIIAIYYGYAGHHYKNINGWTDYSIGTIFSNLGDSLRRLANPLIDQGMPVASIYSACVVGAVLLLLLFGVPGIARRLRPSAPPMKSARSVLLTAVMMLTASMLSFGPGSITTALHDRYVLAPFIFGALALLASIAAYSSQINATTLKIVIGLLALAAGMNLWIREELLHARFDRQLQTTRTIERLVEAQKDTWPDAAQVVVLLDPPAQLSTGGLNHWSTWYLRGVSGRPDIIGLIGRRSSIEGDPFVEEYRDHDSSYWTSGETARSRRIKMRGLEADRSLFVYLVGGSEEYAGPYTLVFRERSKFFVVGPGETPAAAQPRDSFCIGASTDTISWPKSVTLWNSPAPEEPADMKAQDLINRSNAFHFNGSNERKARIALNQGESVDLIFRLRPGGSPSRVGKYTRTFPPMPLLMPDLAIYQLPNGFVFRSRMKEGGGSLTASDRDGVLEVRLHGEEGCGYGLSVNGADPEFIGIAKLSGALTLGAGFLDRKWIGAIDNVTLLIDGVDKTGERIVISGANG